MDNIKDKNIVSVYFIPTVEDDGSEGVDVRVSLSQKQIQDGVLKKIGQRGSLVLLVLTSYMNRKSLSYPSQSRIADLTGMSVPTVRKALEDLEDIGIITTHRNQGNNVYEINNADIGVLNIYKDDGNEQQEELKDDLVPDIVFTSSKDVATYFAKKYKQVFGTNYTINFGRDLSLIKNKVLDRYSDNQIQTAIDIAIENYEDEWANPKYFRPTISMFCSWLINEALAYADREKHEEDQVEQRKKEAEETDMSEIALDLF